MNKIEDILLRNRHLIAPITPFNFNSHLFYIFDFTSENQELANVDLNDEQSFNHYIFGTLSKNKCEFGVGGYGEHRTIYSRSDVFSDTENRSLHLGVDIWAEEGTPIYAPLDSTVHSFKDNNRHGDYGPTIILKHNLKDLEFYSLYGHLSRKSIEKLTIGQQIKSGEEFAWFGNYDENVHWPPHLHFQLIKNIDGYFGDYPGVCKPSEKDKWLLNSPDPNLILKLKGI